ncbi:MAG: peptidoglycan-binding domain-containing protein [Acidobacteriota bacterium]
MNRKMLSRLIQIVLIAVVVTAGLTICEDLHPKAEASARARSRKQGRKAGAKRSRRRSVLRRTISKRRVPSRVGRTRLAPPAPGTYPIAPDRIEVIEHHSADSPQVRNLLDLPKPAPFISNINQNTSVRRRISTRIETERVVEIQRALRDRGIYDGELSGVYDEVTVESMRKFQADQKIPVTGYPTAHSLKRLGLAK